MPRKKSDLTGKRFGRLVAIRPTEKRSCKGIIWQCECDCGNITYIRTNNLTNGHIKSCGCLIDSNIKILNQTLYKNNTSGHKGISYDRCSKKWHATIRFHYVLYHLLYSKNINDCISVREEAEEAVANGIFEQWIADYKGRRIS